MFAYAVQGMVGSNRADYRNLAASCNRFGADCAVVDSGIHGDMILRRARACPKSLLSSDLSATWSRMTARSDRAVGPTL